VGFVEGVATTSVVARTLLADEYVDFLRTGVNTPPVDLPGSRRPRERAPQVPVSHREWLTPASPCCE
jgi:hypothetical protein